MEVRNGGMRECGVGVRERSGRGRRRAGGTRICRRATEEREREERKRRVGWHRKRSVDVGVCHGANTPTCPSMLGGILAVFRTDWP